MRPLRRTMHDTRVEIMPLIDVVFLLLTFFIYAMVLMVRAEVLPVPFESYTSSEPAKPNPAISITIAVDGNIYLGTEIVTLEDLTQRVSEKMIQKPNAFLYVVMEEGHSITDRGPLLTNTWDLLRTQNIEAYLVGAPRKAEDNVSP